MYTKPPLYSLLNKPFYLSRFLLWLVLGSGVSGMTPETPGTPAKGFGGLRGGSADSPRGGSRNIKPILFAER
jgi:hypothetical protein